MAGDQDDLRRIWAELKIRGMIVEITEYHDGVAVIKDKSLLPGAMEKGQDRGHDRDPADLL